MKKLLAGLVVVGFAATAALAGNTIELDLDATTGNGPDDVAVANGGTVTCDVWIMGVEDIVDADVTVCNPGGALAYSSTSYAGLPGGWLSKSPIPSGNCVKVGAFDGGENPGFAPAAPPILLATISWTATTDDTCEDLVADISSTSQSNYTRADFQFFGYSSAVDGSAAIGAGCLTGTEEATWSAIKNLFR